MFWITGLKILGKVGTHIFFLFFFFLHFERHFAFQKLKFFFFSRKPEKKSKFHQYGLSHYEEKDFFSPLPCIFILSDYMVEWSE